ncbi:type II secretion system protein GspC [Myxococcus sp. RHSTA-1-4]|uniref:type II secretion system protein GspC n=1 Tax=Myxococcus sp. RHSTA-1-4 TaxID=2874601 RepID=UPI001CBB0241|nr:type II secretion system protein GspC [Myxococcus sp. RHSTA-1-4]MBZ4417110.1 general secretion pathway protein GspC [Myxococcus sp. RHSTA-1-4]
MELFFRKYFWTVNLLFILLVALLAARTVNLFVESAISPVPAPGTATRAPSKPRGAETALASLDMDRLSKLTGIKIPEPEVAVKEPETPQVDPNAPPVKSGLRVKLLGTLVAANPEWSFASIQDMVTQRSQTYMVGNNIQGATVEEIERERVIILNNGRREFIDGQPGDGAFVPPSPPVAQANTAPPPANDGSGIRALSDNEYEVPRAEIDKTLNNLNDVAMQARIVPAFKDGQAVGFKLFSIRPNSIYSKIGVQNGDVIRRINGFDMNSPEKALEIYSKMKDASRIEIEIERNGAPIRKSYNVR